MKNLIYLAKLQPFLVEQTVARIVFPGGRKQLFFSILSWNQGTTCYGQIRGYLEAILATFWAAFSSKKWPKKCPKTPKNARERGSSTGLKNTKFSKKIFFFDFFFDFFVFLNPVLSGTFWATFSKKK